MVINPNIALVVLGVFKQLNPKDNMSIVINTHRLTLIKFFDFIFWQMFD